MLIVSCKILEVLGIGTRLQNFCSCRLLLMYFCLIKCTLGRLSAYVMDQTFWVTRQCFDTASCLFWIAAELSLELDAVTTRVAFVPVWESESLPSKYGHQMILGAPAHFVATRAKAFFIIFVTWTPRFCQT